MKKISLFVFLLIQANLFAQKIEITSYDSTNQNIKYTFTYPDTLNNLYLRQLRVENNLNDVIKNTKTDIEKVLQILNWTHNQWTHNGNNEPSKSDAITILKEAKEGKRFRCVEYGIVSATSLQSLGFFARSIGISTKDVETREYGAGHVVAEVWITSESKWAFIDGQFNIMPTLNGIPLNAVEFKQAIENNQPFKLVNSTGEITGRERKKYLKFISNYIYFITTSFDKRNVTVEEKNTIDEKSHLMLVPLEAKEPKLFQRIGSYDYVKYTNSLKDFYQKPK